MHAPLGVGVEPIDVRLQVPHEIRAVARALLRRADGIELEANAFKAEIAPQCGAHDDMLGVDVRAFEPERLDPVLVELPVAPLLRPLVPVHRPRVPKALGPVVEQVVLDRGAHTRSRTLRAQRQILAIELVTPGIHLLFDDVGDFADRAPEQLRMLHQRHADVAVAVALQPGFDRSLEMAPPHGLIGQYVVHAAHGLDVGAHACDGGQETALTGISLPRPVRGRRRWLSGPKFART